MSCSDAARYLFRLAVVILLVSAALSTTQDPTLILGAKNAPGSRSGRPRNCGGEPLHLGTAPLVATSTKKHAKTGELHRLANQSELCDLSTQVLVRVCGAKMSTLLPELEHFLLPFLSWSARLALKE